MIKKMLLLPLMMMLSTIAVVPGNNSIVKANAEETIKVEEGYITKNLVDSSKNVIYIDDTSIKSKFDSSFSSLVPQEMYYDGSFIKNIMGKESRTLLQTTTKYVNYICNKDFATDVLGTSYLVNGYYNTGGSFGGSFEIKSDEAYTYPYIHFGVDYRFTGTDYTKPLELALPVELTKIESFISQYSTSDIIFPVININGENRLTLNYTKETNKFVYTTNNARVYFSYNKNSNDEYVYGNYVFLEIPYTQVLDSVKILSYRLRYIANSIATVGKNKDYESEKMFYVLKDTFNSGFKSPIILDDLNFKDGTVVAISSNSIYIDSDDSVEINYKTCKYYQLKSITFNNGLKLYTKPQNKYLNGRQEVYDLYLDENYKTKFTYDSTDSFAKELSSAKENVDFNVNRYDYTIKYSNSTDGSDNTTASDFVDCGTHYAFKKISIDQIHSVSFKGLQDSKGISAYRRLGFTAYDNSSKVYLNKINALWFHYTYKNEKYSFCITKKDLYGAMGGTHMGGKIRKINNLKDSEVHAGNVSFSDLLSGTISKVSAFAPKTLIKFTLTGLKDTDEWFFDLNEEPTLKNDVKSNNNINSFLLYTSNKSVNFDSLISAVYFDEKGTIINGSSTLSDGTVAPTALIDNDGNVTVIDVNGNELEGYIKDGKFYDKNGNEIPGENNVTKPKSDWDKLMDLLRKIGSTACVVMIVMVVVWLISKLGPTLAIVFTNRSKNKKKKRRK